MKEIARSNARVRPVSSSAASFVEPLEGRQLLSAVIKVAGGGTTIATNDKTPTLADNTEFGPVTLKGAFATSTRTFSVKNSGTTTLYLNGARVALGGSSASDFSITKNLPATIKAGKSATFQIKFDPTAKGASGADVTVTSNGNHSVYKFRISGSALKTTKYSNGLEVAVATKTGTGALAASGMLLQMNYTGFYQTGGVFDSSLKPDRTPFAFVLGTGNVIAGWHQGLAGTHIGDDRVLFIPSALGYGDKANNGIPANTPLIFTTSTLGIGPSLKVSGGSPLTTIADGDTTPATADFTEFGARKKKNTVVRTFTIAADITTDGATPNFTDQTTPIHVTGTNASEFVVGGITSNNDGTVSFTVTFKPSTTGTRTATIEIPNNNPIDGNYTFAIQGRGT